MIQGYSINPIDKNKLRITKLENILFASSDELEPIELADGNWFVSFDFYMENKTEIDDWLTSNGYASIITWLATNSQEFDETTDFVQYDIDGNRIN